MKSISLVGTIHDEVGPANIPALVAILERIRPEIIFLEAHQDDLDKYLNGGTTNKLESAAVRQYCASSNAKPVAVDLPTPDAHFFEDYDHLKRQIRGRISDYQMLMKWDENYVLELGFPYLNSEHYGEMQAKIHAVMRATIEAIKDQKLVEIFEAWNRTNERRENEMLKNILKYCGENSFEKAVFLIGAAHRQAIIDKSNELFGDHSNQVQWDSPSVASPAPKGA